MSGNGFGHRLCPPCGIAGYAADLHRGLPGPKLLITGPKFPSLLLYMKGRSGTHRTPAQIHRWLELG